MFWRNTRYTKHWLSIKRVIIKLNVEEQGGWYSIKETVKYNLKQRKQSKLNASAVIVLQPQLRFFFSFVIIAAPDGTLEAGKKYMNS